MASRTAVKNDDEKVITAVEIPKDWDLPSDPEVGLIFQDGTEEFTQPVFIRSDMGARSVDGKAPYVFVGWDDTRSSWSPAMGKDLLARFTHHDAELVGLVIDGTEYRDANETVSPSGTIRQTVKAPHNGLTINVSVARYKAGNGTVGGSVRMPSAARRTTTPKASPVVTTRWA